MTMGFGWGFRCLLTTGGQDYLLEASSAPSPCQTWEGNRIQYCMSSVCHELCVRSYVCSVVLVVVGGLFEWCSHRDQLRSPLPLILKSRGLAHVEGDLRCPNPPDPERERNTGSVPELHLWLVKWADGIVWVCVVVNRHIVLGGSGLGVHHLIRGWGIGCLNEANAPLFQQTRGELSPGGGWLFVSVFVIIVVRYIYLWLWIWWYRFGEHYLRWNIFVVGYPVGTVELIYSGLLSKYSIWYCM